MRHTNFGNTLGKRVSDRARFEFFSRIGDGLYESIDRLSRCLDDLIYAVTGLDVCIIPKCRNCNDRACDN